jgi:hypothetical protein
MGHNIVPSGAGWATFGWLTGVFVLGTIIFALSLQVIIARLRRVEKIFDRLIAREGGRAPPKTEFIVEEISVCIEQIPNLRETLRTPFPQPPSPRTGFKKFERRPFSSPVSREGREVPQVDLINGLGIRGPGTSIDEIIHPVHLLQPSRCGHDLGQVPWKTDRAFIGSSP